MSRWEALLRKQNSSGHVEFTTITGVTILGTGADTVAMCPSANQGTAMTCYCCCPVPYDPTFSTWVAVFTVPIGETDTPLHADDLPFPLVLPLYPNKDIMLLAFKAKRACGEAPPTVYLHFPSNLEILGPLHLSSALWRMAEPAWTTAIQSLSIGSWLSYAFDGLWSLSAEADISAADEDADEALPAFESASLLCVSASTRQAIDAVDVDSSSTESVCDEEEEAEAGNAMADDSEGTSDEEFDYGEACEEDNEEDNEEEDDKDEPDD